MAFGLFNIDKPKGPTSHDIVARVRQGIGEKRVGHAGTLDPLASGVLVVAVGPATRLVEYLTSSRKTYRAEITLGIATDTYDAEGTVTARQPLPSDLTAERVNAALAQFKGDIFQTPPVYSAIKIAGKSAHARVRAGQQVELEPRPITIYNASLERFEPPLIVVNVTCSPGTYIRSFAHDLGETLGCGAMLSGLVRTASGQFRLEESVIWADLELAFAEGSWHRYLLPADRALAQNPEIQLDAQGVQRIANGMPVAAEGVPEGLGRAYTPDRRFIAVLQGDWITSQWKPIKVFADVIEDWRRAQPS